jgi:hypothetical protein
MSPDTLVAFIDESHYEQPQYGFFYTMTGAVVDLSQASSHTALMRELNQLARSQPGRALHAYRLASHDPSGLAAAQHAIVECDAVRLLVTVRTWSAQNSDLEEARQTCLAELATRLHNTASAERLTLDTRDSLGGSTKSSKPQPGGYNAIDAATLVGLKKAKELSPAVSVVHADDQRIHQLWIPDIVGYIVARSIARKEPSYMGILAPRVELREALVLPVAQRGPGVSALQPTELGLELASHLSRAQLEVLPT